MYLLQHSFKKDVDDPERLGIPEQHMAFYYNKYFRKTLTPKYFGCSSVTELINLVKDTVSFSDEGQVLASVLPDEVESPALFVKFSEEGRRERVRRMDAGDETAR